MAAGDAVILGTAPKLGFTGSAPAATWREDQEIAATADEEVVHAEDNSTVSVVITNPATEVSANCTVQTGGITQPIIGESLTLASVAGRVVESKQAESRLLTRYSVKIRKEDSITL